ncbi:MAG: hypothetical protein JXK04_08780, partial [Campylobacterales bacterium]|nr:hypothetical protein [Campylobacterales bacterium]
TNTCDFDWGNSQNTATEPLNGEGYPSTLNEGNDPFGKLFKNPTKEWTSYPCGASTCYKGPATNGGAKDRNLPGKPEGDDYWEYNATSGTFKLIEP